MKRLGLPLATLHSQNLIDSVKKMIGPHYSLSFKTTIPFELNCFIFCIIANVRIVDSQVFWVAKKKRKEILSLVSEGGVVSHLNI